MEEQILVIEKEKKEKENGLKMAFERRSGIEERQNTMNGNQLAIVLLNMYAG